MRPAGAPGTCMPAVMVSGAVAGSPAAAALLTPRTAGGADTGAPPAGGGGCAPGCPGCTGGVCVG